MRLFIVFILICNICCAQYQRVEASIGKGIVVAGYVDNGAYINFTGPSLDFVFEKSNFIVGMLPSLRFKEDTGITKNSFITPNLGVGFTYSLPIIAIQLPFYYNPKSLTQDGKWFVGVGVGINIEGIANKRKE